MIGIESAMPETQSLSSSNAAGAETQATDTAAAAGGTESPQPVETKGAVVPAKAGETPAYAPNFKFKVLDKEHEFDDWAKASVKDADTEKKVREIYEKAFGLDSVKQDRHTLKTELTEYKDRVTKTDTALGALSDFVKQKDYDSFFESLNISKTDILQYALKVVEREQMPPEQKAVYEEQRNLQQRARYYEQQNQQLMQSQQQFAVQQRGVELQNAISKPEVAGVAQAYDAGMGNSGAFRDYVVRIAQAHAAQGNDIPAEMAVTEAVRHLRAVNPTLGVIANAVQAAEVGAPAKPVIPNIQGRGTSPVKSTIRSLDDLKNRAKELNA